jgi:hypothetical protein
MNQPTKGNEMTNEEKLKLIYDLRKDAEAFEMSARNLHKSINAIERQIDSVLPDPAPSEPVYGWRDLADDLGIIGEYCCTGIECGPEYAYNLLRGTCVEMMQDKGWNAAYAKPAPSTVNKHQCFWAYAECIGEKELVGGDYAPSEPAAWRDMLKHAGVI